MGYFKNIFIILMLGFFMVHCSADHKKIGLLIVAHGSNNKGWNDAVELVAKDVVSQLKENNVNSYTVRVAFLEGERSIAEGITSLQTEGISRVYVQPLFFTPSGHLNRDIPAVLGFYYEESLMKDLHEEGIAIADRNVQVTLGPPLSYKNVVKDIILTRIKAISKKPGSEKLVILSHGSSMFQKYWEKMVREIGTFICKELGIAAYDFAFIKVGQDFVKKGYPVIKKGINEGKRVIVTGVYLARGAKEMAASSWGSKEEELIQLVRSGKLVFSEQGILPDRRIGMWIADRAIEYYKSTQAYNGRK